jgi:hypothetical protein
MMPLELGKHAEHLKHRFAYGRGRASWCKSPLDRIQVKNENFCSLVISSADGTRQFSKFGPLDARPNRDMNRRLSNSRTRRTIAGHAVKRIPVLRRDGLKSHWKAVDDQSVIVL